MSVGKVIAEVRKQKKVTQKYLSKKLGRTPQWLSNIERGIRPITADELARIAEILEVEPYIFFTIRLNKTLRNPISGLPKTGTD